MSKPKISIILSSIREGRAGQNVADWIMSELSNHHEAEFELVDLKNHPLPMFDSAGFPSMVQNGNYENEEVKKWAKKIGQADGFIMIVPEYNHGYSSALKNAIDWIYGEWNNKAVGFVSYGSIAGGSRAVEQLRQVAAELQLADVRAAVHIPNIWAAFNDEGKLNDPSVGAPLEAMVQQVTDWSKALQATRVKVEEREAVAA